MVSYVNTWAVLINAKLGLSDSESLAGCQGLAFVIDSSAGVPVWLGFDFPVQIRGHAFSCCFLGRAAAHSSPVALCAYAREKGHMC